MKWPGPTTLIFLGIFSGILLGFGLKNWTDQPWTDRELMYLQFPGEIFLRIVNCLILPLVISSIVSASSTLTNSGSIGQKAFCYYVITTTCGIILSVLMSQTIRPGEFKFSSVGNGNNQVANLANVSHVKPRDESQVNFVTVDTLLDLMRNLVPDNLIKATTSQYQTVLSDDETTEKIEMTIYDMKISHQYISGTNVLGLVFSSLIFGLGLGSLSEDRKKPLVNFFESLVEATAKITDAVISTAPIAVVFLISGKILKSEEESGIEIARLGMFVITVFTGLTIQALLVLPAIYFLCTRRSPHEIMMKIGPALVTACGTSSSTATVPTTIRCLDKMEIDPQVSRFIAPIGASINMDGIALYETIGALFIMQMRGMQLSLIEVIAISITCTLSCIGAAGIPSGGYAMLIMVLNSLGVPAEDVTLIIAVDSFVDRFRTMVNIVADSFGAAIISHYIKKESQNGICLGTYYESKINAKESVTTYSQ